MATCKLTGTQRYKRTQIESPAGFHKMKVFKQCCLSKVKMLGSWRLLALGLTADLCTELSFNAPLTSVVTRLSSFSRLSQRAQLYVFKKLAKLLYLFRCTCTLLEHQFPSISQATCSKIRPSHWYWHFHYKTGQPRLFQCSYVQAVCLFTQVTGRGGTEDNPAPSSISCRKFPALPSVTPHIVPLGLLCVQHDHKLGAEG